MFRKSGVCHRVHNDFDPISRRWIAENEGIPPDIEVIMNAKTSAEGRDAQLERAVQVALRLLRDDPPLKATPPAFPTPTRRENMQRIPEPPANQ